MPSSNDETDDPRRIFLLRLLATGMLGAAGIPDAGAQFFGRRPQRLPAGQSVYEASGSVTVNGHAASVATRITANDRVATGSGAQVIFVVGSDAFILRENSRVDLDGANFAVTAARLVTGALLSVFGRGAPKQVATATATIGIRGTGLYVEASEELSYVCNCYGEVEIAAADDPSVSEHIVSKHHDAPRYILKAGAAQRIQPAPVINHTDLELTLIETLVGRRPPFALFDEDYGRTRRY